MLGNYRLWLSVIYEYVKEIKPHQLFKDDEYAETTAQDVEKQDEEPDSEMEFSNITPEGQSELLTSIAKVFASAQDTSPLQLPLPQDIL